LPIAQYLLAVFAQGQHWDLFERLVKRRVELPDEASQNIIMFLAMAKKTDALEWLITSGAVVRHASFIHAEVADRPISARGLCSGPALGLFRSVGGAACRVDGRSI
jgi:hypothetical protein